MAADQRHVAVITMTFNQRPKVLALLDDLAGQEFDLTRLRVVVLDDGGSDGTHDAVVDRSATLPFEVVALRRERMGAYLSAQRWNECIAAAGHYDVIVQVDDVRLRPDFLYRHSAWHADGRPRVVTGAKFDADELTWELDACPRRHLAGPDGEARRIEAWTACWGASLSYPRLLVERLSTSPAERPFDERMTGWGFHEVEFACRAAAAGAELIYDPAVGVFHQRHGPITDARRGVDHAAERAAGTRRNQEYVRTKHGLTALPRW